MSGMTLRDRDRLYLPMFICGAILMCVTLYWFGRPLLAAYGLTLPLIDGILVRFVDAGCFATPYGIKGIILILVVLNTIVRSGATTDKSWTGIVVLLAVGLATFFWPAVRCVPFIALTLTGYLVLIRAVALLGRKVKSVRTPDNDGKETFEQCERKIENEYSINIPTKYRWKHRDRNGWINVVNPFRATMVLGTPGSGKSFSVYNPFIEQMMAKSYTCFLYDYKFPDLTEEIYNEYLANESGFRRKMNGKVPRFCVINFDDPRYSMRCNPIHARYITDPADTSEIADIIMRNVNPQSVEKEDFFTLSAKVYIDAMIWFLRIYKDGRYCTFPHLIELMGCDYRKVFRMLQQYDDIRVKIQPFQNALDGKAQEQLQGQIASAQIPLLRFASPALYWVLSGDDFSLDVNDTEDPKIVCIGNNPDRQTIYGTTLALYTSRMFRQINHKGRYPCGVLLDELPTIFIKGIDNLIATARSNKVAIVLGAQDKSQLRRDYGDKESEVVFNTVGNVFAGQVNGQTAKSLSETLGKEFREQQSETSGDSSSVSRSFQMQEIMPQSRIETLSQGFFFGKVADNNEDRIDRKLFCGEIQIDMDARRRKLARRKRLPRMPFDDEKRYFDDEDVERRIRADEDGAIRRRVTEDLRREEREKKYDNETYTAFSEGGDGEREEVERRISALSKDGRRKLLDDIVKTAQRSEVDRVLKENYDSIKADILRILKDHGLDDGNTSEKRGGNGTMPTSEDGRGGKDKRVKPDQGGHGSEIESVVEEPINEDPTETNPMNFDDVVLEGNGRNFDYPTF